MNTRGHRHVDHAGLAVHEDIIAVARDHPDFHLPGGE